MMPSVDATKLKINGVIDKMTVGSYHHRNSLAEIDNDDNE
jgi:hypothetical protein